MRCRSRIFWAQFFCLILMVGIFSQCAWALPWLVRTPAKKVGDRFTVKVQLVQDGKKYVVPFWLDPHAKESLLDTPLIKDLGWLN